MMKSIKYILLVVLGLVLGHGVMGQYTQELITGDGKKVGEVSITYMMISPTFLPLGKSLKNLNHRIDIGKYPDAELRIVLEVLNLKRSLNRKKYNYYLQFIRSSTKEKLNGFYTPNRIKEKLIKKGEKYIIDYKYNEGLLKDNVYENHLFLTFFVYDEMKKQRDTINHASEPYKIINTSLQNSTLSVELKAEKLYLSIQKAAQKNDGGKELRQLCEEFANKYADDDNVSDDTKDKARGMCNYLSIKEDPKTISSKNYYVKIKTATDAGEIITILNDYSRSSVYKKSDPYYAKIYYHIIKNESIPKLKRMEYCKQYILDLPNSQYTSQIKELLVELQEPTRRPANPDDKKWQETRRAIRKTNSGDEKIRLYESYLKKYDDHKKNANTALKLLKASFTIEEIDRTQNGEWATVKFQVRGTESAEPAIRTPSLLKSETWSRNVKSITLKDKKVHRLIFYLPHNDDKLKEVILDLIRPPLLFKAFNEAEGQLVLTIEGGELPYRIVLKDVNGIVVQKIELKPGEDELWYLDKNEIVRELSGEYTICIADDSNGFSCAEGKFKYVASGGSGVLRWLWLPLALLILVGGGYVLQKRYKRNMVYEANYNRIEKVKDTPTKLKKRIITRPHITINPTPPTSQKKDLKIPAKKAIPTPLPPVEVLPQTYKTVDLSSMWQQTVVQSVAISEECIKTVREYLQFQHREQLNQPSATAPESGGLLIGEKTYLPHSHQFDVKINRFEPIRKLNDQHSIIIDQQHLDSYKTEREEVVGWVHTHPGWGVFLSEEDLLAHKKMFDRGYHLALVVDLFKSKENLGIFTSKNNFVMNNAEGAQMAFYDWNEVIE